MELYIGIIIYYVIMSFLELGLRKGQKQKKAFSLLSIAPLFLLTALRGASVGTDTIQYQRIYNSVYTGFETLYSSDAQMEWGYRFLNCLCNEIGLSYFQFQILVSLFIFISLYILIKKYSTNAHFTCFLLMSFRVIFSIMNISRSWIATALFILIGVPLIRKRKLCFFIMFVLLDSLLIHTSVIICAVLYPLINGNFTKKKVRLVIFGAIVAMFIGKPVLLLFVGKMGRYSRFLNYYDDTGTAVILNLMLHSIFFLICIMNSFDIFDRMKTVIKTDVGEPVKSIDYEQIFCGRLLFMSSVVLLTIDIIGLRLNFINRVSIHFMPFYAVFITNSIHNIRIIRSKFFWASVIIIVMIAYFYIILVFRSNWNQVIPYVLYK